MRAVIQRVSQAGIRVNGQEVAFIGQGLLVLLGVEELDDREDIEWLARKIMQMRIFSDQEGKMNLSVTDVKGKILVVSQFTLHASTKKGNRPSFIRAANPKYAHEMYLRFVQFLHEITGLEVQTGEFGAMMEVSLINDGPVTIIMDTKLRE